MKRLNGYKMKLMLIGFMAALVLGGSGSANADFTFDKSMNLGPTILKKPVPQQNNCYEQSCTSCVA